MHEGCLEHFFQDDLNKLLTGLGGLILFCSGGMLIFGDDINAALEKDNDNSDVSIEAQSLGGKEHENIFENPLTWGYILTGLAVAMLIANGMRNYVTTGSPFRASVSEPRSELDRLDSMYLL